MTGQQPGQQPAGGAAPQGGAAPGAEHPAPAAFTAPWTGVQGEWKIGEGDKAQPWWSGITEEPVREYMKAKNYANPEEAARAAWSANKMFQESGRSDALIAPKADAKPEEWDAFYTKLGRPESPDKYDLKIPEGTPVDENLLKVGKGIFHKLGATPARAQEAFNEWQNFVVESNKAQLEAENTQNGTELAALEKTWGGALEEKKAAGLRVVQSLWPDAAEAEKKMDAIQRNIGAAPLVELLALIGSKSAEGTFKGAGNNNSDPNHPDSMTGEQATARIAVLNSDPAFQSKFTNKNDPGHKEAVNLMERLYAKAK